MGQLTAAMLAELRKPAPQVYFALEVGSPAGTALMSREGVSSLTLGHYKPWIVRWGSFSRRLSSWRGGVQASTLSVDVDETSGQFTLAHGRRLRGQACVARMISPNVATSDYHTWFEGIVDSAEKSGRQTVTLGLRQNDDFLTTKATKAPIRGNTFPGLPAKSSAVGQSQPYIAGTFDSTGLDAEGMVPCLQVGPLRYIVSLGWHQQVVRVYSANTLKANPTDYSVTQIMTGDSRKAVVLDFVADQGANAIVADTLDVTSATGPAAVFRQVLSDLVLGDYHSTSFDPDSRLDTTAFTAADAVLETLLGLGRAFYVPASGTDGAALIRDFSKSYEASFYTTRAGLLAPLVWDYLKQNDSIYYSSGTTPWPNLNLLTLGGSLGQVRHYEEPESVVTRLGVKAGLRPSDGSFLNQRTLLTVETQAEERADEVELAAIPPTSESLGTIEDLTPDGTTQDDGWTISSGTIHSVLGRDPTVYPDTTTYIEAPVMSSKLTLRCSLTAMPSLISVESVTVWVLAGPRGTVNSGDDDTLEIGLYLGTTFYPLNTITGMGPAIQSFNGVTVDNPDTSLKFTQSDLSSAQVYASWDAGTTTAKRMRLYLLWARVNYTAAADTSPACLLIPSRRMNRYRQAPPMVEIPAPLEWLDREIGDPFTITDPTEGWGIEGDNSLWRRRLHCISGMNIDPQGRRVTLTAEDVRDQQTSFWLWGKAGVGVDGSSAAGDGMALLTHGGAVSVTRAYVKNLHSPAGIGVQSAGPLVQVLANCWPSGRYGTLPERERSNELKRSSFVSGLTGLTQSAGSGAIYADTTIGEQLFAASTVTANSLVLTAGTPHVTETRVTWPASATITANTKCVVSIYRKGSSTTAGDGLYWRLQRGVDSKYWRDSDGTWQIAATDNELSGVTSYTQANSKIIDVGVSNTALTFSVSLPSGGTSGRTVRVGHVQLEQGEWASSPIVTDASIETRLADQMSIANDNSDGSTTFYTHPNKRGTMEFVVEPLWSSANVASTTQFWLWRLAYDASNRWELYYTVGTGWRFTARSGGSDVTATVSGAVVAGTRYTIRARWTSALGEEGKTSILTLSVDNGSSVSSADSATYTTPVLVAAQTVNLFEQSSTANRQIDAYVISARVSPFCWTDAEMGI